jgi:redox-sensitive bicupin YhaK (pirin superfamily)
VARGVLWSGSMNTRSIQRQWTSVETTEGAGVTLHRAIGLGRPEELDPFLLLDDFRSDTPADYVAGFPWHPHRGMETITYVLRGEVHHGDSLGNRGVTGPGDVQWMTGGSGIIHQEMPRGDRDGAIHGFQLWANLPASHKMMKPRYRGVFDRDIPRVHEASGVEVRVIAGALGDVAGPVQDVVTRPQYFHVSMPAHATFVHAIPRGHTAFAYVIGGRGTLAPGAESSANRSLVHFTDGDQVSVRAGDGGLAFLLVSGQPIGEPIAWQGPIVMNTPEEIELAFEELDRGTFIKDR